METHPVPQNISSYEFRLVGDMTLKQFLYLAGGILLGNPNGWSQLRVEFHGSHIEAQVNGTRVLALDDSTSGWPGQTGVWVSGPAMAAFDDFEVKAEDHPTASADPV